MRSLPQIALLALLAAFMAAACHSPQTRIERAATAIYMHYADISPNLNVAYMGNYHVGGHVYNAVMLQAIDSATWCWLQDEFGTRLPQGSPTEALADSQPTYTSLRVDSAIAATHDSTLIAQWIDSAARQLVLAMGIDTSSDRTDIVLLNTGSESTAIYASQQDTNRPLVSIMLHNGVGYVIRANQTERTLWLFLFASAAEQEALLKVL